MQFEVTTLEIVTSAVTGMFVGTTAFSINDFVGLVGAVFMSVGVFIALLWIIMWSKGPKT